MVRRWHARHGWEWSAGLGLTGLALGAHLGGLTQPLEWAALDASIRHFSRTPASGRIVHIDIDDAALDRVGSWPWPRDLQGDLLRTLKDLGAERIVTDIVWSEPRPPEVRLPGLDRFADLDAAADTIGEASLENLVSPDDELAGAIAEAGNVTLPMYYEADRPAPPPSGDEARLAALLREQFELDAPALAARTGLPQARIEPVLPGVKRRVAEERVAAIVERQSDATFEQVHRAILTTPVDRLTADRADLLAAYHRVLSLRALRERCPPVPAALKGRLPRAGRVVPPVYKFTRAARHIGFVTFRPDRDGRTRHVPLLVEWQGRLLEHLAMAVARDTLGIALEDLAIDREGFLVIRGGKERADRRIQLDEAGQLLIHWHVARGDWPTCFDHRPAALLLQVCECRRRIAENDRLRRWRTAQVVSLVRDEAGFAFYGRQVRRLIDLERQIRQARLRGGGESPEVLANEAEARRLRQAVTRDEQDAIALVREEWADLQRTAPPTETRMAGEYQRFRRAHDLLETDLDDLDRTNAEIEARYRHLRQQLRPLIAGRICFVGYTATAVADMVTTPAYRHVPGVLVHSNVLNSFLTGRFLTWSRPLVQGALIVLFGLTVTVVTAARGPRAALGYVAAVVAGSFLLDRMLIFAVFNHWMPLATAAVLTFVAWALIVLLRYLTTERQKRRFSRAVAQYVSPAMARRLADQADRLDFSPVDGQVSCFFSDLAGFTPISERLGPAGTRTVLNPYLQAMSGVLHRHGALINKFMGDGIFAFFNAPILPCADHEAAACEAALGCRTALEDLKNTYSHHPLAAEFQRLATRVGIASGPVFVGDYGSESKLDYTCVGDTVNLAARLEPANKVFGTAILVADSTRRTVGPRFAFRRLGAILVPGRTRPVEVHELLGRPGETDDATRRFAESFERGVAAFARRDFEAAAGAFRECLIARPDDPGSRYYLAVIESLLKHPPAETWTPCLAITIK